MTGPHYEVIVADRLGVCRRREHYTFEAALDDFRKARVQWPMHAVRMYNNDLADEHFDGLTLEEREACDDLSPALAASIELVRRRG